MSRSPHRLVPVAAPALVEPKADQVRREKWRSVVEPRWAEVLLRLEHLETVFANRVRYGSGVMEADCDEIIGSIRAKLDVVEKAFRRCTRKPVVRLPD
jgi:hypothetical protein